MPGNYTLRKTYVDGDILSASDYVADHQQHIDNQTPLGTDDQSANLTQMRTTTDTGDVGSESLATTLAGELERIRYQLSYIKSKMNGSNVTQWYSKSFSVVVANSTITSAKLADGATFIQGLRTQSNAATAVLTTETTILTQNITTTRSRVRIAVAAQLVGTTTDAGGHVVTFKLKRGATVLVTKQVLMQAAVPDEDSVDFITTYIDNVAAGTKSYTVTATADNLFVSAINFDSDILVEEIA